MPIPAMPTEQRAALARRIAKDREDVSLGTRSERSTANGSLGLLAVCCGARLGART